MAERKILIVDDERSIRLTLQRTLEELGFGVGSAVNGEDALKQLEADRYGLMLLDLRMPGMDGMEVLRWVAEHRPEIRVVILTAHGTVTDAVEAMKLGAVDFIQKPFSPQEIRDLVQSVHDRDAVVESKAAGYEDQIALAKRAVNERHIKSAIEHARRAIGIDPSRAEAFNLLGALQEIIGERLEAQKNYRIALEIDPTNEAAKANLDRSTGGWSQPGGPRRRPELG